MATEFDRLAEYFRQQKGFEDIGERAAGLSAEVRARGGPETIFEAPMSAEQAAEIEDPEAVKAARINTLVGALLAYQREFPEERGISTQFARTINESFGQHLPDDVPLRELRLPQPMGAVPPGIDVSQLREVQPALKRYYNQSLNRVSQYRTEGKQVRTVGDLRAADPAYLLTLHNTGPQTVQFITAAFASAPKLDK